MDYFKELMDRLGAKEMPVLDSDFETGSRNYQLEEDGFVISFFECIGYTPSVSCVLVSKKHNEEWFQMRYSVQKKLIEDDSFIEIIRRQIEIEKDKINKLIEEECQYK